MAGAALLGAGDAGVFEQFDIPDNRRLIRGGETLFRQGEAAEALFVVTHGSLEVFVRDEDGMEHSVDVVTRGGFVGEMALLTDEPRSATVRAVRNTELVRVDKADFDRLLAMHPRMGVQVARTLVRRVRNATLARRRPRRPGTIGLVPVHGTVPEDFARGLLEALRMLDEPGAGMAIRLDASDADRALGRGYADLPPNAPGEDRLLEWLAEQEDGHARVVFDCDAPGTAWNARALRQADLVFVVASATESPDALAAALDAVDRAGGQARLELVLLHEPTTTRPWGTARWLQTKRFAAHHHLRAGDVEDVRRLARAVAGRSVGLVLGGGGARGFAHIGVLRAVAEAGLPVDVIGGASMGSIIAAMHASGYSTDEMIALCRKHYAQEAAVPDRTVPVVALSSGRNTVRKLRAMFGERQIEDLWTRYYCVSCNLSRAATAVHDSGLLWVWTRVSCAIPGLAPPVAVNGDLHADGGILDNLPTTAMRERCDGLVIACDVSVPVELQTDAPQREVLAGIPVLFDRMSARAPRRPFPSIFEIMARTAMVASVRDSFAAGRGADLYLHPPLDGFGMASFREVQRIVEIGYQHAQDALLAWKAGGGRAPQ